MAGLQLNTIDPGKTFQLNGTNTGERYSALEIDHDTIRLYSENGISNDYHGDPADFIIDTIPSSSIKDAVQKINQITNIIGIGGTGGTPGGADTEVQFNDAGAFGGDSTFVFDKTTDLLTVLNQQVNGYFDIQEIVAPLSPAGNISRIYSKDSLGETDLFFKDSTGKEFNLLKVEEKWVLRQSTEDNVWLGVTYGNGLFVALSGTGSNRIMTSPDGVVWTAYSAPSANFWEGIVYGNGLFVGVSWSGSGNRAMTSPDGITWTSRVSANDNRWKSVTYGNGLFVAVGSDNSYAGAMVMTSPDGIIWTARAEAVANSWESVVYGNGLFVAVSSSGTGDRVMTSPDGITWTSRVSANDNDFESITYGNGLFVAIGGNATYAGAMVMTSPDGIAWTARAEANSDSWESITYGNGLFVAVANGGISPIMYSYDGINWVSETNSIVKGYRAVTYGDGLFVAVSSNGSGNRVATLKHDKNILISKNDLIGLDTTTQVAKFEVNGSLGRKIVTVDTSSYSISLNDHIISVDYTASGIVTLTLPSAANCFNTTDNIGIEYIIKDSGANSATNNITINVSGTDTIIDSLTGQSSTVLASNGGAIFITAINLNTWIVY